MIQHLLRNGGFSLRRFLSATRSWKRYRNDRKKFKAHPSSSAMPWGKESPMLTEWNESSGGLGGYFHQDFIVAQWIYESKPLRHVDVGSRIDGFIAHLAVFRNVEVIDIRPQPAAVTNVQFHALDITLPLPDKWIACADSVSCLHSIEHFGLGRYGDEIDPEGHIKGLRQLKDMVKIGGTLYLSCPIGNERVEFNAQRVFSSKTLLSWFGDGWHITHCAVYDNKVMQKSNDASLLAGYAKPDGLGIIAATKLST